MNESELRDLLIAWALLPFLTPARTRLLLEYFDPPANACNASVATLSGLLNIDAARAEAVKNSMFPGAAVMYWLGTRAIHDLRQAAEARDGSAFSLKRFHDRLLSFGAIPVPLIARLMEGGA